METDSAESGFLSIFALLTFFIFLITNKYSYKLRNGIILDRNSIKIKIVTESSKYQKRL